MKVTAEPLCENVTSALEAWIYDNVSEQAGWRLLCPSDLCSASTFITPTSSDKRRRRLRPIQSQPELPDKAPALVQRAAAFEPTN
jgi:hypothetical protein